MCATCISPIISVQNPRTCCLHQTIVLSLPEQPSGLQGHALHGDSTVLLAVSESLRDARSPSLSSVLILLDLSAAFDTVNQQILLSALAELGIAGTALSWFTSYLTDRIYQVTWNSSLSRPCTLDTEVPQGSVLGPLLFSSYTRYLGSVITSNGFSYHCNADNT